MGYQTAPNGPFCGLYQLMSQTEGTKLFLSPNSCFSPPLALHPPPFPSLPPPACKHPTDSIHDITGTKKLSKTSSI